MPTRSSHKKRQERNDNMKSSKPSLSKKSNGGVAKFRMSEENEKEILKIIAQLNSMRNSTEIALNMPRTIPAASSSNDIDESSHSENDDDSDDNSDDDEDDSDSFIDRDVIETYDSQDIERTVDYNNFSDEDVIQPTDRSVFSDMANLLNSELQKAEETVVNEDPATIKEMDEDKLHQQLSRKLIRDDRKSTRDGESSAAAVLAKKNFLKSNYPAPKPENLLSSSIASEKTSVSEKLPMKTMSKKLSPTVLLETYVNDRPSKAKPLVVSRSESIDNIIAMMKKKHNASKKFDCLVVAHPLMALAPTSELLEAEALLNLNDSSAVTLVQSSEYWKNHDKIKPAPVDKETIGESTAAVMDIVDSTESDVPPILCYSPTETPDKTELQREDEKTVPYWEPPALKEFDGDDRLGLKEYNAVLNEKLLREMESLRINPSYEEMCQTTRLLPIYETKGQLLDAINSNQVVVVSGETGSGKSTQLPTYILDDAIVNMKGSETFIICTQPRRIAAISVAERVAQERIETIGHTVGYQIRLQSRYSENTKILFCTTGILLARLQSRNFLHRVSHIIIDEVHERQVEIDFLMTFLRDQLQEHAHLKLILMSATLDEKSIAKYFSCPIVYVKGRNYPVQENYIDDIYRFIAKKTNSTTQNASASVSRKDRRSAKDGISKLVSELRALPTNYTLHKHSQYFELIAELVSSIINNDSKTRSSASMTGDGILIFLSGFEAIRRMNEALVQAGVDRIPQVFIHQLHGSFVSEQQRKVFRTTKSGEWKIILSTNIAETSITVDDVNHVIDTGLMKEVRFDPESNMSSLQEIFISRTAGKQRAGRAGRVRPGNSWKLYSEEFFNSNAINNHPIPEICRIPLEEVVLQVLLMKLGIPEIFLGKCLQPPSIEQIRASVSLLLDIEAVLPFPSLPLTPLGYHLARIPMDVRLSKMLVVSTIFGKGCIELALTITASLCGKFPFYSPPDRREESNKAHRKFYYRDVERIEEESEKSLSREMIYSDHLAIARAYNAWNHVLKEKGPSEAFAYARRYYISHNALFEIHKLRESFRHHLISAGLIISADKSNRNQSEALEDIDRNDDITTNMVQDVGSDAKDEDIATKDPEMHSFLMLSSLCAGLSTNVARMARYVDRNSESKRSKGRGRRERLPTRITQADGQELFIHPSSGLRRKMSDVIDDTRSPNAFIVYHKKMAMDIIYLFDCSSIPLPILLLFGGDITTIFRKGTALVNRWIPIKIAELHAVIFKRLQREFQLLLKDSIDNSINIQRNHESKSIDTLDRQDLIISAMNILRECS